MKASFPLLLAALVLTSCTEQPRQKPVYEMGERISVGPFNYVVVESAWRSELGEGFQIRAAKNRFLMLTLSLTNGGASDTSVPALALEGADGTLYQELSDGTGVNGWLGLLRTVRPTETLQGKVLFDVPLGSYRLRLPEGDESGYEKYIWVQIPLTMDAGEVQAPLPIK